MPFIISAEKDIMVHQCPNNSWVVYQHGRIVSLPYFTKEAAITEGERIAKQVKGELTICKKDGTFSGDKRSYGNDPRNIKG